MGTTSNEDGDGPERRGVGRPSKSDGRTETDDHGNTAGDKHPGVAAAAAAAKAKPDNASSRNEASAGSTMTTTDRKLTANLSGVTGRGREGRPGRVRGGKTICARDEDARQTVSYSVGPTRRQPAVISMIHRSMPSKSHGQLRMCRRLYERRWLDVARRFTELDRVVPRPACMPILWRPSPTAIGGHPRAHPAASDSIEINRAFYGVRTSGFC